MRVSHHFALRALLSASCLIFSSLLAATGGENLNRQTLSVVSQQFAEHCATPEWQLWQSSLCGPLLFVDPVTRQVFATRADAEARLTAEGGWFVGWLPENETIANTAKHWAGVHWSMIMLPLPERPDAAMALLAHESWHRIQDDLNLPIAPSNNGHLSALNARYLFLLELRALAVALAHPALQRQAMVDALGFRRLRYQQFETAEVNEQKLELNEGLAEYTGYRLAYDQNDHAWLIDQLNTADQQPSLERSFAYLSGPAYGVLLDQHLSTWRENIRPSFSFSKTLGTALALQTASPQTDELKANELTVVAKRYQGDALLISEQNKTAQQKQQREGYIAKLVEGKVLRLPLGEAMSMSFNPQKVFSLSPYGTVYPEITLIDAWGKISVSQEALLSSDFAFIAVALNPAESPSSTQDRLQGEGWELVLNPGWLVDESGLLKPVD
jgi:hypothetical protein